MSAQHVGQGLSQGLQAVVNTVPPWSRSFGNGDAAPKKIKTVIVDDISDKREPEEPEESTCPLDTSTMLRPQGLWWRLLAAANSNSISLNYIFSWGKPGFLEGKLVWQCVSMSAHVLST